MAFKDFLNDKLNGKKDQEQPHDEPGRDQQRFEAALAKEEGLREVMLARNKEENELTRNDAREDARRLEPQGPAERLATRVEADQVRDAVTQKRDEQRTLKEMIANEKTPTPDRGYYLQQNPRLPDRDRER